MTNGYAPKFPRKKLREIVTTYIDAIEALGREPNARVVFDREGVLEGAMKPRGWLLNSLTDEPGSCRHLLLPDGDVWREAVTPAPEGTGAESTREWLSGPDDDLVVLMARSLSSARAEGHGFLAGPEDVELDPHVVDDRRSERRSSEGAEQRGDGEK